MSDTITTRPARPDDLGAIRRAIFECGLFSPDEAAGFAETVPSQLGDPGHVWLVAACGGAGMGAAYMTFEPMSAIVLNLWFIGVPAGLHRRGAGRALMAHAERAARGLSGRLLLVETSGAEDFAATRAFYAALGYPVHARIEDYYAPGEAKLIHRRAL